MEKIGERMLLRHIRKLRVENGRIYFSRAAERRFFFALTVIMLVLGAGAKLGIW